MPTYITTYTLTLGIQGNALSEKIDLEAPLKWEEDEQLAALCRLRRQL